MKALVTGSAGFIGSHLMENLISDGYEVVGIDNFSHACGKKNDTKFADIRYYHDIEKYVKEVDIVYHLAAQIHVDKSIDHVEETLDVNIMGTYNILEACRKYNKPIVFASTSEVYGTINDKIDEGSPTYSQSPYAVSKLAGDKLCGNYHNLYGLKVWRLRNFNTYGEWQNSGSYGAVIPIFTRQCLAGERITIYGDGEQKRDFMNIRDCIKGYRLLTQIEDLVGEPVNVGSGVSISINDLGRLICKLTGVGFDPIYLPPRAGEVRKLEADTTLISKYGWQPEVSFEEGLIYYISWFNENLNG